MQIKCGLKAHLSHHLREVKAGAVLTILDGNTPIARLTPIGSTDDVIITPPSKRVASFADPCRFPEGIPHVLVNGVAVKRAGAHTRALPGQVLARGT